MARKPRAIETPGDVVPAAAPTEETKKATAPTGEPGAACVITGISHGWQQCECHGWQPKHKE
jgi:hypothetical protein